MPHLITIYAKESLLASAIAAPLAVDEAKLTYTDSIEIAASLANSSNTIVVFETPEEAEDAIRVLQDAGAQNCCHQVAIDDLRADKFALQRIADTLTKQMEEYEL